MSKPNAEQVGEAVELIKDHHRQYGAAATEARLSSLVYSIYSVLTGDGKPAADHAEALEKARQERKAEAAAAVEAEEGADTVEGASGSDTVEGGGSDTVEGGNGSGTVAGDGSDTVASNDDDTNDDEEEYTEEELQTMTVAQLKELAAEGEVDLTGTSDKASIIAAIMNAE